MGVSVLARDDAVTAPAPKITRGAIALRQCGANGTQIAARTGAAYPTVNNWLKGHRTPGPDMRVILARFYAIEPHWWDEGVGQGGFLDKVSQLPAPVAQPERAPACTGEVPSSSLGGGSTPVDPRGEAEALVAHVRRYRAEVETDQMLTLNEKAKVLELASRAIERLYRLTGEASAIPESRILASPAWKRIRETIEAALEPHPEALRAVVGAVEELTR